MFILAQSDETLLPVKQSSQRKRQASKHWQTPGKPQE
jgi:hypothetical protein